MRIYSSPVTNLIAALLFSLSTASFGLKASFDTNEFRSLLGDLTSVESEEQRSILKSLLGTADANIAQESRETLKIIVERPDNDEKTSHDSKDANSTSKSRDSAQWYATPTRIVEHQIETESLENHASVYKSNDDENPNGISSREDHQAYTHTDGHYHVDHNNEHSGYGDNQNGHTYSEHRDEGSDHDVPTSDVFYKKLKLKKVRRNCTRAKVKKAQGWPDRADLNVESRSGGGLELPHYNSKSLEQSVPALPETRYNDISKNNDGLSYPALSTKSMGFSGEHLHGIPRTHFFQYKDGQGVNHYHLHNHNHIYDSNGKRINMDYSPQYRNLAEHFGKLKSILSTTEAKRVIAYPQINNHYRSTLTIGDSDSKPSNINDGTQKKGYHYTGSHESYGRKTYRRINPETKTTSSSVSTEDHDKSIGSPMYRYGAGQYGTDEFSSHEHKGPYPNEVSLGVDKPHAYSGEIYEPTRQKPYTGYPSSPSGNSYGGYNSDSSVEGSPYTPYSSSNYNQGGKTEKYNPSYQNKSPFEAQDKAPYEPQDKAPYVPQDKPSYSSSKTPSSAEFPSGFGGPSHDLPRNPSPYPDPFGSSENKNAPKGPPSSVTPSDSSKENQPPPSIDVTHSVSYSQDGELETIDLGPENMHLYQNLRPEPDPLTIPKNARIFEHHIRLHPMHYLYSAMARRPMNMPAAFGNLGYPLPVPKFSAVPKYPVPLHKLMPNPLKMPLVPPAAPLYPRIPVAHINPMLHAAYQRSIYPRYW